MVDRRRQWRAENQDISIIDQLGRRVYVVSGSRGREYTVDLEKPACECPDWQKREPKGGCKHILYVKLQQGNIESLPSAKTNFGSYENRSSGTYNSNWSGLSKRTCKRDNWTCQKCGARGGPLGSPSVEAHHIVPKSKGGEDRPDNLITLCRACHEEQHGHVIPEGGQYTTRHSRDGMDDSDLESYLEARDTGARKHGKDSPSSSAGVDPEMDRSQRGYRQPDEETTAPVANSSTGDEYTSELNGTLTDKSTENVRSEQTTPSNKGSSQDTTRVKEAATIDNENKNDVVTVGQELVAGLLFTIIMWVVMETIFSVISWDPGTSSNRFLLILLAFEVLILLPDE